MDIIPLLPEHWPAVKTIYESGSTTGNASFQTAPLPGRNGTTPTYDKAGSEATRGRPCARLGQFTPGSVRCVGTPDWLKSASMTMRSSGGHLGLGEHRVAGPSFT